ncbi:Nucleotidylyl transferase [Marasmius fiardii PR-910]|nr:Nucleotidylyl transferase [Marasmius fiardii PR-910]
MSSVTTALLLATLPTFYIPSNGQPLPTFLAPVIHAASRAAKKHLIIVLFSRFLNKNPNINSNIELFPGVQRLLTYVYVEAVKEEKTSLDVDVILRGFDEELNLGLDEEKEGKVDIVYRVSGDSILVPLPTDLLSLPQVYVDPIENNRQSAAFKEPQDSPTNPDAPSTFSVTALGGTFDHLHSGHKILLSMGAFITSRKIVVGVTHPDLLVRKVHADLIEPLETRIEKVRQFLQRFKPGLEEYYIVPIKDVAGPTGTDPDVQALIVSKETLRGADEIAKIRESKSFPPLQTFVIDVISNTCSNLNDSDQWKTKMSSTAIRESIAQKRQNKEEENQMIFPSPAAKPRELER